MASESFSHIWDCVKSERTAAERRSLAVLFAIGLHEADAMIPQITPPMAFGDLSDVESVMLDNQNLESIAESGCALHRLPGEPSLRQTRMQLEEALPGEAYSFKKHQDFTLMKVAVRSESKKVEVVEDHAHLNLGAFVGSAGAALNGLKEEAQSSASKGCFYAEAHEAAFAPVLSSVKGNGLANIAASDVEFQRSKFTCCESSFGSPFSACSPRAGLYSMQLLRAGAPRLCIVIAPDSRHTFVECIKTGTTSTFMCSQAVEHQAVWPSLVWLGERGIGYQVIWQETGELLILAPDAYLYGMNTGSYILETLHYAHAGWSSATLECDGYQFCRGSCNSSVGYFGRNSTVSFKIATSVTDSDREREAARILAEREKAMLQEEALDNPIQPDTEQVSEISSYTPPVTRSTISSQQSTGTRLPPATPSFEEPELPARGSNQNNKRARPSSLTMSPASRSSRNAGVEDIRSRSATPGSTHSPRQGATTTRSQQQRWLYYNQERSQIAVLLAKAGIPASPESQQMQDADNAGKPKRQCRSLPANADFVQRVVKDIEEGLHSLESTLNHYTQDTVDPGFGRSWSPTQRLETAAKFESQSDIGRIMAYFQYFRIYKDSKMPVDSQSNRSKCLLFGTLVDRCTTGVLLLVKQAYSLRTYTRIGQPAIDAVVDAIEEQNYDVQARLLEPLSSAILCRRPRQEVMGLFAKWKEHRSRRLLNLDKLKS